MECKQCEELLLGHACGDLSSPEIELHLMDCAKCREALESYRAAIKLLADEPMLSPSRSESAQLARALDRAAVQGRVSIRPKEVLGFAVATALTFAFLVMVLGLQLLGRINIVWMIGPLNVPKVVVSAVAILIVTSFIPILITAKRRPLNGLTFSR
jgi:hypothetical protein